MIRMNKASLLAAFLICLLASCAAPEMVPPPQPTALPPTRPAQVATVMQTAVPTAAPTAKPSAAVDSTATQSAAPQPSAAAGLRLTSGALTVVITAPQDGATLSTSPVAFQGTAPAGTVISLNDLNLVVGASGAFSAEIKMESGPNLVEFLASNAKGDQVSYFFTVFFDP